MTLLELVIKEYLTIVNNLEDTEAVINDRIIIEREYFQNLLMKYQYMSFKDKTKIYKQLNLIIHDKNNYTMPVKDEISKKTSRKVIINYQTFLLIKRLAETIIK